MFPGAGTSLLKSPRKSLLYVSRCRLLGAAVAAAADPSKRRLPARKPHATEGRQRLLLLCPQKHGPGVPGAGTSLLKSPRKSLLYVSRFLDAGYWELLLLCPQRHGPPGRGNTMALKDEWSPK